MYVSHQFPAQCFQIMIPKGLWRTLEILTGTRSSFVLLNIDPIIFISSFLKCTEWRPWWYGQDYYGNNLWPMDHNSQGSIKLLAAVIFSTMALHTLAFQCLFSACQRHCCLSCDLFMPAVKAKNCQALGRTLDEGLHYCWYIPWRVLVCVSEYNWV